MGILRRLFGGEDERMTPRNGWASADEQALARYRYLVRTAPPEAIEQAHEQAFAQLSPEQRRTVLQELSNNLPEHERVGQDDPKSLARMATRAELQRPGAVERVFTGSGATGGGYGYGGGLLGGAFMSSLAGAFVGSIVAQGLYDSFADIPTASEGGEGAAGEGEYGAQDVGQEAPSYEQDGASGLGGDFEEGFEGDLSGTDF